MEKLRSVQNIRNKKNRRQAGFTMAELLIVVAIIAILAAFGFVNVIRYQKDLRLREYDDIARELFVAAQNHLTANEAAGNWNYKKLQESAGETVLGKDIKHTSFNNNLLSPEENEEGDAPAETEHDWRMIIYNADNAGGSTFANVAQNMMLPLGAIDDTVRTGGSYVIVYDALTATIHSVVYSAAGANLDEKDWDEITGLWSAEQDNGAPRSTRRDRDSRLIGCYGFGERAFEEGSSVRRPIISVENEEALVLNLYEEYLESEPKGDINLIFEGETSKARKSFSIRNISKEGEILKAEQFSSENEEDPMDAAWYAGNASSVTVLHTGDLVETIHRDPYKIFLDSITLKNKHFTDIFSKTDDVSKTFIPGENIKITAYISVEKNGEYMESHRTSVMTNSLFGNVVPDTSEGGSGNVATILNGRHLQNLSTKISAVNADNRYVISAAKLGSNVIWQEDYTDAHIDTITNNQYEPADFILRVKRLYSGINPFVGDITLFDNAGNGTEIKNAFLAVINSSLVKFEGNKHSLISFAIQPDVYSEVSAPTTLHYDAGLFGRTSNLAISDLFMTNTEIVDTATPRAQNSGSMIGSVYSETGKSVSITGSGAFCESYNVVKDARNRYGWDTVHGSTKKEKEIVWDYQGNGIKAIASGSAGGLIGASAGAVTLTDSFAAVKVSGGNAGGLIGQSTSEGSLTAANCYSGGHVGNKNAADGDEADPSTSIIPAEDQPAAGDTPSADEGESPEAKFEYDPKNYNITSIAITDGFAAGGFAGSVAGTVNIKNCYSTSSVGSASPNVFRGGFVGGDTSNNTTYENNYAAGLVGLSTNVPEVRGHIGAFAGKLTLNLSTIKSNVFLTANVPGTAAVGTRGTAEGDFTSAVKGVTKTNTLIARGDTVIVTRHPYEVPDTEEYPFKAVNKTTPYATDNTTNNVHFGDWLVADMTLALRVTNGNRLVVDVTIPQEVDEITLWTVGAVSSQKNATSVPMGSVTLKRAETGVGLQRLKGTTYEPYPFGSYKENDNDETPYVYSISIDDITAEGGHFAQIFSDSGLIPGENILLFVREGISTISDADRKEIASKVKAISEAGSDDDRESATMDLESLLSGETVTKDTPADQHKLAITNSLFGYTASEEGKPSEYTGTSAGTGEQAGSLTGIEAKIYSFRHLENLSQAISAVPETAVITAVQTRDLTWSPDAGSEEETKTNAVKKDDSEDEKDILPFIDFVKKVKEAENISVVPIAEDKQPASGSYCPITNTKLENYDGGNHTIANVKIVDVGEGAGLFARFAPPETAENAGIHDLMLRNPFVSVPGADGGANNLYAGALAGTVAGSNVTIKNVLVYADEGKYGDLTSDSGIHVERSYGGAGGLIGQLTNGTVEQCASAIAVQTSAQSAGGLIGVINGGTVKASYSGGHTVDGKYANVKTSEGSVVYNVTASGSAGGFVGTAAEGAVIGGDAATDTCYSTCSVAGTTAGGFVGSPASASIKNAYATGLVSGNATGAFAGTTEVTGNNLFYVTGVNADTVKGIAGTSSDGIVQPLDDLTLAGVTNTGAPAYRYDGTLNDGTFTVSPYALEEYPFTSVKSFNLPGEETTDNPTGTFVHVGDWEDGYEHVLVVNTSRNS